MGTTIQLVTEPLYRKQLRRRLLETGFAAQTFEKKEDVTHVRHLSDQIFIIQAHLWPGVKHVLNNSMPVVMFGPLPRFHCWFNTRPKHISAYLTPLDSPDSMMASLEQVLQGNPYLSDTVKGLLAEGHRPRQERLLDICISSHLTVSELEILMLIGEGYTTSEIAEKRFRSAHTIKTQRKKIRTKIDAVNGERLAAFAGRKVYALKTLLLIEQNIEMLYEVCKNTS